MFKKLLALIVLIIIVVMFLGYPLLISGQERVPRLSAYSNQFDDISIFKDSIDEIPSENGYEVRSLVATPTVLNGPLVEPDETLYIAVGLDHKYEKTEIDSIVNFVQEGGTAIIADDFGYANDLAGLFDVTYYGGQFLEQVNYDWNYNYTVVNAWLGRDVYSNYDPGRELFPGGDGIWDDDNDFDGKVDEDPINEEDDDLDNAILINDFFDNDRDGIFNESKEGIDEDWLDDDGDGELNEYGLAVPDGIDNDNDNMTDEGFNEEWFGDGNLDGAPGIRGVDDDGDMGIDENDQQVIEAMKNDPDYKPEFDDDEDGLMDEDLKPYRIVLNKATAIKVGRNYRVLSHGSNNSFVDVNGNGVIDVPEEISDKSVDDLSTPGNELKLIIEVPVCKKCGGAVSLLPDRDPHRPDGKIVYECLETNGKCDKSYSREEINDLGRIIFMSDSSLFMNDLLGLDHMTMDENTGRIRKETEILPSEEAKILTDTEELENLRERWAIEEDDDPNNLLDKTPDGEADYDNRLFLQHLIQYLLPDGGKILIDESLHDVESEFQVPVYQSLNIVAHLTSDPWFTGGFSAVSSVILFIGIFMVRDKETWIHKFNISHFSGRTTMPTTRILQSTRVRKALIEKTRMSRGLSPEEFQQIPQEKVNAMVRDPQLLELLTNQNRTFTEEELRKLMEKIKRIGM